MERIHAKTIAISVAGGILSLFASGLLAWVVSQTAVTVSMREALAANKVAIDELERETADLHEADKQFVTLEQFNEFRTEYQNHWKEQHDFQIRTEQSLMEILNQHARMLQQHKSMDEDAPFASRKQKPEVATE